MWGFTTHTKYMQNTKAFLRLALIIYHHYFSDGVFGPPSIVSNIYSSFLKRIERNLEVCLAICI